MTWQPIENIATRDEVLLFNAKTGKMRVGKVGIFDGMDGITRHGVSQGFGLWVATHFRPLPDAPTNSNNGGK